MCASVYVWTAQLPLSCETICLDSPAISSTMSEAKLALTLSRLESIIDQRIEKQLSRYARMSRSTPTPFSTGKHRRMASDQYVSQEGLYLNPKLRQSLEAFRRRQIERQRTNTAVKLHLWTWAKRQVMERPQHSMQRGTRRSRRGGSRKESLFIGH